MPWKIPLFAFKFTFSACFSLFSPFSADFYPFLAQKPPISSFFPRRASCVRNVRVRPCGSVWLFPNLPKIDQSRNPAILPAHSAFIPFASLAPFALKTVLCRRRIFCVFCALCGSKTPSITIVHIRNTPIDILTCIPRLRSFRATRALCVKKPRERAGPIS
jgi:hypothetical protein